MVTNEEQMGKRTNGLFPKVYTKDDSIIPDLIIEHLRMRVNANIKSFSNEEISDARFQIGLLKAVCSDGFPAIFF
jgi:hypothetical protein